MKVIFVAQHVENPLVIIAHLWCMKVNLIAKRIIKRRVERSVVDVDNIFLENTSMPWIKNGINLVLSAL